MKTQIKQLRNKHFNNNERRTIMKSLFNKLIIISLVTALFMSVTPIIPANAQGARIFTPRPNINPDFLRYVIWHPYPNQPVSIYLKADGKNFYWVNFALNRFDYDSTMVDNDGFLKGPLKGTAYKTINSVNYKIEVYNFDTVYKCGLWPFPSNLDLNVYFKIYRRNMSKTKPWTNIYNLFGLLTTEIDDGNFRCGFSDPYH